MGKFTRSTFRQTVRTRCRCGAINSIHLLLILPLMLLGVLAVLQFALISVVESGVQSAARTAADVASRGGGIPQILASIDSVLSTHGIDVPDTAGPARGNVLVVVEAPERPDPIIAGNPTIEVTPTGPALRSGELRVTICVRLSGGSNDPVPNWLRFVGFSMEGQKVLSSALAVRETARGAALVTRADAAAIEPGALGRDVAGS